MPTTTTATIAPPHVVTSENAVIGDTVGVILAGPHIRIFATGVVTAVHPEAEHIEVTYRSSRGVRTVPLSDWGWEDSASQATRPDVTDEPPEHPLHEIIAMLDSITVESVAPLITPRPGTPTGDLADGYRSGARLVASAVRRVYASSVYRRDPLGLTPREAVTAARRAANSEAAVAERTGKIMDHASARGAGYAAELVAQVLEVAP